MGRIRALKFTAFAPFLCLILAASFLSGCGQATFPEEKLKRSLQEIALKEYSIPNIEVEFKGTTLGVYLPLKNLFAMDFKEAILKGEELDMETLFRPSEEAVGQVEDILFSMSRVMLSTDKKIEFYYLQATDGEKSAMDLTFLGHIDDLKRVRFWDIPRSEYRKRIIHDMGINRAVLQHRPVKNFFKDLNEADLKTIEKKYFSKKNKEKWEKEFFFVDYKGKKLEYGIVSWAVLDMRSIPLEDGKVAVYVKVFFAPKESGVSASIEGEREFVFIVSASLGQNAVITQIIPMTELDKMEAPSDFAFTREAIYESLPGWERDFETPDMTMEKFLSLQITRRCQELLMKDERIFNTFSDAKGAFRFEQAREPRFIFESMALLKDKKQKIVSDDGSINEDILYLWSTVAREFVDVLHSYGFENYISLDFQTTGEDDKLTTRTANKRDLELFRKNKKSLKDALIDLN